MTGAPKSVTIPGVERTTAIVGVVLTIALYVTAGPAFAFGTITGSTFMIVNFFLLAIVGRAILAMSSGSGGLSLFGILLIPIKLIFFIGVSYLIVRRLEVNLGAFIAGVLTQPAAILIEVGRTAPRVGSIAQPEIKGNQV
jgi:hypothetical protein